MESAYDIVAPQMRSLQKLERTLKRLDMSWKVIETTARIVCPGESAGFIATLEDTRASFGVLAREMVAQIATTHLANRQRDLASRAQVAIDILVRNLFERTADVGFIATDAPLVSFVQAPRATTAMRARLAEYRAKYTVYDDILVLDAQAQPLLSLQDRAPGACGTPNWWHACLNEATYIERHGADPLFPGVPAVLLYAHRIVSAQGQPCGAVVLRFDLASELASIFAALHDPLNPMTLLLVDQQQRVVASSQPAGFAAGDSVDLPPAHQVAQTQLNHQGQQHLFQVRATRGYQGYTGLPWRAVALVSPAVAFGTAPDTDATPTPQEPTDAEVDADNSALRDIIARARDIELGLTRVIWNGKLADAAARTDSAVHPVFDEIGRAGQQTVAVFDGAIVELRQLLMAGRRAELRTHAALAVNLMDRNLYERANDCRWWALSEELAAILADLDAADSASARARAAEVLAHLNSLYTVYRRVALFNRQGQVVAVSRDAQTLPAVLRLDSALVQRTLGLKGTQAYAVSAMQPDPLSDGDAAYVYCAALRATGNGPAVGGIALAFNCRDELRAMLRDATPDGSSPLGFFISPTGHVLASTHDDLAPGQLLPFAPALLLGAGHKACSLLVHWQGQEYLAGVAPSTGYREFKCRDGYSEPVFSVLLSPIRRSPISHSSRPLPQMAPLAAERRHIGVVACGSQLLGLGSTHVLEAMSAGRLVQAPGNSQVAGLLEYVLAGRTLMLPALDFCRLAGQTPLARPQDAVAVVVRSRGQVLALLVERLVGVIECGNVHPPPEALRDVSPWINGLIFEGSTDKPMVFTTDPDLFDPALLDMTSASEVA